MGIQDCIKTLNVIVAILLSIWVRNSTTNRNNDTNIKDNQYGYDENDQVLTRENVLVEELWEKYMHHHLKYQDYIKKAW